jgi:2-oxoglutarate dehydrogenase E1 component
VAQPSTPANFFHLLRRQLARPFRKPLVVATPKQLLRLPEARSALQDFGPGTAFQPVLPDEEHAGGSSSSSRQGVRCIVLCSGKLFYELAAARRALPSAEQRSRVALLRLEELAPWPAEALAAQLQRFSSSAELLWAQEEPANAGAWAWARMQLQVQQLQLPEVRFVGPPALAAAAPGLKKRHAAMQSAVIREALAVCQ